MFGSKKRREVAEAGKSFTQRECVARLAVFGAGSKRYQALVQRKNPDNKGAGTLRRRVKGRAKAWYWLRNAVAARARHDHLLQKESRSPRGIRRIAKNVPL